jgi:acid phosphatase
MTQTRREFVRTLFAATAQAALAGPLLTRGLFAAEASSGGLPFLAFGDWGRNGQKDQLDVSRQMALASSAIGAKFLISVGDNFYDYGVTSTEDPQWQTSFEKVYADPALRIPWHVIQGNHDYRGNCQAQIDYSAKSPRWKMPARYFSRTEKLPDGSEALFVFADTSPFVTSYASDPMMGAEVRSQDTAKQITWIDRTLGESKAPWKIVIGHHPIYSGGEHGDTPELIDRLLPVLRAHKVPVYLNGHDHDLQHLVAEGLNMFCTGAGSTVRPTKRIAPTVFSKSQPGFVAVSLKPEAMDLRMISGQGQVVYSTSVPRSA